MITRRRRTSAGVQPFHRACPGYAHSEARMFPCRTHLQLQEHVGKGLVRLPGGGGGRAGCRVRRQLQTAQAVRPQPAPPALFVSAQPCNPSVNSRLSGNTLHPGQPQHPPARRLLPLSIQKARPLGSPALLLMRCLPRPSPRHEADLALLQAPRARGRGRLRRLARLLLRRRHVQVVARQSVRHVLQVRQQPLQHGAGLYGLEGAWQGRGRVRGSGRGDRCQ